MDSHGNARRNDTLKQAAESRAQSHAAEKINQTGESIGHGAINQRNFSASRLSIRRPIQLTAE
jgi:hypothetical protein